MKSSFANIPFDQNINHFNDDEYTPAFQFPSSLNDLPQSEQNISTNYGNHTSESHPNQIDNLTNITQSENQTQTNCQQNSSENIQHSLSSVTPVDLEGDLELLNQLRLKYTNNPSIGYLDINSLRGQKFSQLEELCKLSKIDIL